MLLWVMSACNLTLLLQFIAAGWTTQASPFERLVGVWVEAELVVPASVALGLAAAGLSALGDPQQRRLPVSWLLVPSAVLGALGLAVLSLWPAPAPRKLAHPDVYLLVLDTLRRDFVDAKRTPNLAALADRSYVFDDAVSASSWTRPAVASMLTGRLPEEHGATSRTPISPAVKTVTEVFQARGYQTVGLVSNPQLDLRTGMQRGFDYYAHVLVWDFPYALSRWLRYDTDASPAVLQRHRASLFARTQRDPNRPLFMMLHFMDPHSPLRPPEAYLEAERDAFPGQSELRSLYGAEVRYMDDEIGAFLAELRAAGRLDDSVIAVVSDHGEELDEGRSWPTLNGRKGHGHSMLPEVIRVPMQVKPAGDVPAPQRCTGTMSTRRLGATLLRLSNISPGNRFGSPLLTRDGRCSRELPMTYQSGVLYGPEQTASRDGQHTVILNHKEKSWLSFDRKADPEHWKPEAVVSPERRTDMLEHLGSLGVDLNVPRPEVRPLSAEEFDDEVGAQLRALGYVE